MLSPPGLEYNKTQVVFKKNKWMLWSKCLSESECNLYQVLQILEKKICWCISVESGKSEWQIEFYNTKCSLGIGKERDKTGNSEEQGEKKKEKGMKCKHEKKAKGLLSK